MLLLAVHDGVVSGYCKDDLARKALRSSNDRSKLWPQSQRQNQRRSLPIRSFVGRFRGVRNAVRFEYQRPVQKVHAVLRCCVTMPIDIIILSRIKLGHIGDVDKTGGTEPSTNFETAQRNQNTINIDTFCTSDPFVLIFWMKG